MTFATSIVTDAAGILMNTDEFAESVSYTRYTDRRQATKVEGYPHTIPVVFGDVSVIPNQYEDGDGHVEEAEVVLLADATAGIADPVPHTDAITRDSEEWTVEEITGRAHGCVTVRVRRVVRIRTGPMGFETQR